jgi:predicted nucleic acid-binding Zn ribbon protein
MRKSEKSQKRADFVAFAIGFILILVLILIYLL